MPAHSRRNEGTPIGRHKHCLTPAERARVVAKRERLMGPIPYQEDASHGLLQDLDQTLAKFALVMVGGIVALATIAEFALSK